nr:hypothetical protein [Tanacetum cinerariifolium]
MTTLADKAILSGADNRPPMLEKDMYDSWKSIMELYMMNRQHGRMILESVKNGLLLWPTVEENGVTRPKKYSELFATRAIQADCDERIQLLMQGASLTKQERECKLYNEFDKFAYKKGESLRDFYLRFSLLLNDMNIYNMKLEQFQVNTKFLNTLPPEWSKFVIDVKLVRDLHTKNGDQLHAYLGQHEYHANEVRLMHERPRGNNSGKQRAVVCYNYKEEGHMSKQCTKPKRKRDEAWFKDKVLLVQAQVNGQVLYEEELEFFGRSRDSRSSKHIIALIKNLSHYGSDNLAENLSFPTQQDDLILSVIEQLKTQVIKYTKINQDNKSVNEILTAELKVYKDQVRILKEGNNIDNALVSCAQSLKIDNLKHTFSKHLKEKESLEQMVTLLKNDFQKEESRNIDRELGLEKQVKELSNIVCNTPKMGRSGISSPGHVTS